MDHRAGLELALAEAEIGRAESGRGIGSIIVDAQGAVVGRGRNREFSAWDRTAHAEIDAIRQAGRAMFDLPANAHCTLYTTWEPCLMCAAAIVRANIGAVVWAVNSARPGAMLQFAAEAYGAERTAPLVTVAEPFADLAERSRAMTR